ncbi:hypothetical protein BGZ76_007113 [Entomortierella beljakovae]|nr:hypothetical protein BGZ76_007113 [Entomortierella beljakovae]
MGIPCRVIERHHEISGPSKALVIHTPTLEIFQMIGQYELGLPMNDGSSANGFGMESHYKYGLFIEQSKIVAILTGEFERNEARLYLDKKGLLHQKYGVSGKDGQGSIVVL